MKRLLTLLCLLAPVAAAAQVNTDLFDTGFHVFLKYSPFNIVLNVLSELFVAACQCIANIYSNCL